MYMSSTVDPRYESILKAHEIFKGVTNDGGRSWSWSPITSNSRMDNLRPIVPIWNEGHVALVWMRGTYRSMHDYDLDIVCLTEFEPLAGQALGGSNGE
jgi:hypothetical protein